MDYMNKSDVIENICQALLKGEKEKAQNLAKADFPFQFHSKEQRKITLLQSVKLFLRDGFIDRYSGHRLVYPGILRLLFQIMPQEFPFQKNWKMSECHIAYYELLPTIDHVIPVARGGSDNETNWVTTSMLRNSAKSNWILEELGWSLFPAGNLKDWDGLTSLYIELIESLLESQSVLSQSKVLSNWYKLAKQSL
jgi:5-methylcytosine-specific restriction endonuclease McrA